MSELVEAQVVEEPPVEAEVVDNTGGDIEVSQVTIGELIPFRGVWYKVTESDGKTVTLEAITVTTGWRKKQARTLRKEQGKHFVRRQRKIWFDQMNQRRAAMAAVKRQAEAWLEAEKVVQWLEAEDAAGIDADVLLAEITAAQEKHRGALDALAASDIALD